MKKLFKLTANWLIHHSEEYQSMAKAYAETIQENQILSDKNQQLKIIIRNKKKHLKDTLDKIEKIINRYTNAKDIKKYIKEVL